MNSAYGLSSRMCLQYFSTWWGESRQHIYPCGLEVPSSCGGRLKRLAGPVLEAQQENAVELSTPPYAFHIFS